MRNPEEKICGNNRERKQKEKKWKRFRQETEKIADPLGMKIDKGIEDTVTALRVYKFPTSASCEGHINEKEGHPYPWVEICALPPEGWEEDEEIKEEWRIKNLEEQKRITDLLTEFYKDRNTSFDKMLSFRFIGSFGGFRIQSTSAEQSPLFSEGERKKRLEEHRKEMNDFAEFLKKKYIGE
ncbi:MAG: hypothetical protein GF370_00060 [Candidatus Nealsonbacteria bacterium]|nr:hypothetical protein [Candidatus Nealsonbacteria bacterium]